MAKTIVVNRESLEELNGRLESVKIYINEATEHAERAEVVIMDYGTCRALKKAMNNGIDKIIALLKEIIKTFSILDTNGANDTEHITTPPSIPKPPSTPTPTPPSSGQNPALANYQGLVQTLSDNCTNTALAMMVQRQYILQYGSCNFSYSDMEPAVESYGGHLDRTLPDGKSFHTHWGDADWISTVGNGNLQAGLAAILPEFPAGIVLYAPYASGGAHAVLVTGCTVNDDGSFSFTAIDPANGQTTDLTQTTLFTGSRDYPGSYSSVDELLSRMVPPRFYYSYIESLG